MNIKPTFILTLAVALLLVLAGCGGGSQAPDTQIPEAKVVAKAIVEPTLTNEPLKPEPTKPPTQAPSTSMPTQLLMAAPEPTLTAALTATPTPTPPIPVPPTVTVTPTPVATATKLPPTATAPIPTPTEVPPTPKPRPTSTPTPVLPLPELSSERWTQVNGPFGGILVDFVKSEGGFWAASSDKAGFAGNYIYRIDQNTFTWERIAQATNLKALATNASNPDQVAFVTAEGWNTPSALFLSDDGGTNWESVEKPHTTFGTIAISRQVPNLMFVGVQDGSAKSDCEDEDGEDCDSLVGHLVLISDDFGSSWTKSAPLPHGEFTFQWAEAPDDFEFPAEWNDKITVLHPHPYDNDILYVGTNTLLAKTTDKGQTWDVLSSGFPRADIQGIAVNPNAPHIVYVRVGNFVSRDCDDLDPEMPGYDAAVSQYCAGVYVSTDSGATWDMMEGATGDPSEGGVYINEYDEDTVYAVFSREVLTTKLNSGTWNLFLATNDNPYIPDVGIEMIVSGDSPAQLFSVGRQGLYRTEDNGTNWIDTNTGFVGSEIVDMARAIDGTMYAATYDLGMFKSTDDGANWSFASYGMRNWYVMQIATHPTDPNIVFITTGGGMYRSDNAGISWDIIGSSSLCPGEDLHHDCHYHGLIVDSTDPNRLLVGGGGDQYTPSGVGLAASEDLGVSWFDSDNGFIRDVHVSKLVVDPTNPEIIYATTQGPTNYTEKTGSGQGVFKSTDHGHNWYQINNGLKTMEINVLALDPNASEVLYVGTDDDGLYKSSNAGESWQKLSIPGTPPSFGIGDVVIDPRDGNVVYVGTVDYYRLSDERGVLGEYGVFKSTNGGQTFAALNQGLDHVGVFSLELDADEGLLYAGTRAGGVYWLDIK